MRRLSAALALLVVVPGCLGPDDSVSGAPREHHAAALADAYLNLMVRLAPDEGSFGEVARVELGEGSSAAELFYRDLVPGNATLVARILLPEQGTWEGTARLVLFDGGAELAVDLALGPVEAGVNRTVEVTVSSRAPTEMRVIGVFGPAELVDERRLPTYGRLIWADGRSAALFSFPHVLRVPASYPILWDGRSARFEIDALDARWTLDGSPHETGSALVFDARAGRHTIVVEVPHGEEADRWVLSAGVWARTTVNATALVPQPRELGREPAPWTGTFELAEGAYRIQLTVSPGGDTPNADLDLTFFAPSGELIGTGQQVGSMPEVLTLVGRGLEAGTYEVRVVSRDTAAAMFTAEFVASY